MTKSAEYKALIECTRNCNKCQNAGDGVTLLHCNDCKEINLWSYWQGGITHLDAKILLVGQDWGDKNDASQLAKDCNEKRTTTPPDLSYVEKNSKTNDNLIELFQLLKDSNGKEYDITKNQTDLFFTNFVLCYRDKGYSGNFKKIWSDNCHIYFKRLVDIIQPKVILCLGRSTYNGVLQAFHLDLPKDSWNSVLDNILSGKNQPPLYVSSEKNYKSTIIPLAHCGGLGTANRNRDIQKRDWKNINNFL